jgi:hypothetical protein
MILQSIGLYSKEQSREILSIFFIEQLLTSFLFYVATSGFYVKICFLRLKSNYNFSFNYLLNSTEIRLIFEANSYWFKEFQVDSR